jgi:hypothetical protein
MTKTMLWIFVLIVGVVTTTRVATLTNAGIVDVFPTHRFVAFLAHVKSVIIT